MTKKTSSSTGKRCSGIVVPMITPVTPQGELDEGAVCRVIDHLIAGGVSGVFVLGTTGESVSIPGSMKQRLVALTVEHTAGRAMTYAGIGDTCLANSVQYAEEFFRLGVDVVVAHLPYYFPLTADEMYAYYTALIDHVPGPLMIYNIPGTTRMSIPIDVVKKLSKRPNVVGLKDSENDIARIEAVIKAMKDKPDFSILCGWPTLSAQALALGADGTVPNCGNLAPDVCYEQYQCNIRGDVQQVKAYQKQIDYVTALIMENRTFGQSIGTLKAAMGALNLCGPDVLSPLLPLDADQQKAVRDEFSTWQDSQKTARL